MKKILLLTSALLLSCSDLSVDNEESLKGEIPADFKRSAYVEINNDVIKSQVLLKVQEKTRALYAIGEEDAKRRKECIAILSEDISLAETIYTEYMNCPAKGWNPNKACKGKYSGNPAYTKTDAADNETCAIGACWSGGWSGWDETDYELPPEFEDVGGWDGYCAMYDCPTPVEGILLGTVDAPPPGLQLTLSGTTVSKLDYYANRGEFNRRDILDSMLNVICKFVMPEIGSAAKAKSFLQNFTYDSTLIDQHYFLVGRSEGRPYKFCKNGENKERNQEEQALELFRAQRGYFFDYSRYLYCYDDDDFKIYVTQEVK